MTITAKTPASKIAKHLVEVFEAARSVRDFDAAVELMNGQLFPRLSCIGLIDVDCARDGAKRRVIA